MKVLATRSVERKRTSTAYAVALVAVFFSAGAGAQTSAPAESHANKRPNIVLILCDDLGIGDVSAFNPKHGKIATPHIDALTKQGMMFTDAHSPSALCTPTRYGLLTGRYSWRTRLQNGTLAGFSPPLITPDRMTLGTMLQAKGYATAVMGKWHLGLGFAGGEKGPDRLRLPLTDTPLNHGFDHFYGIAASLDMPPFVWIDDNRFTEEATATKTWVRPGPAGPNFEAIDVLPTLAQKASEYIKDKAPAARAGKPFFLYLPLPSPHTPILPTPEWQGKSGLGDYGDYGDFVMQTDAVIGKVVDALETAGVKDETWVIVTSDNGFAPMAGPEALLAQGHDPSAGYRGYKTDVWEGGHRMPLVMRWPGTIKPGTRCDQELGLIDLFATFAEVTGTPIPDTAGEDSISALPLLKGEPKGTRTWDIQHSGDGYFVVREGNWKLALSAGSGGWGKPRETAAAEEGLPKLQLYDLSVDPAEQHNLLDQHPDIAARLEAKLHKAIADGRTTPGSPQKNDRAIVVFKKPAPATRPASRLSQPAAP